MSPMAYLTPSGRLVPIAQRQRARMARPIQKVYESKQWRTVTRPAVLERDGYRCVHCGQRATQVAHRGKTQDMLRAGVDVYGVGNCESVCASHNSLSRMRA